MIEFLGPLIFAFWVYCVITVIMSREDQVKHLPKVGWLILVLLFPLVGGLAWVIAGRASGGVGRSPHERAVLQFPEYDRPGRAAGVTPESDEEFLKRIRERAEEQRRIAREQKRREEEGEATP
jgi:hypothetical protein